jgi:hypothetical protein
MYMDVAARMTLQNGDGTFLVRGVPGAHPEQQTAMLQFILQMLRMMISDQFG